MALGALKSGRDQLYDVEEQSTGLGARR
jgi:hypothetical protein